MRTLDQTLDQATNLSVCVQLKIQYLLVLLTVSKSLFPSVTMKKLLKVSAIKNSMSAVNPKHLIAQGNFELFGKVSYFHFSTVSGDKMTINFELTSGQCGIETGSTDDTIFYAGSLYGSKGAKHGIISRESKLDMPFKCEFNSQLSVTVDDFFTPLVRKWLQLMIV